MDTTAQFQALTSAGVKFKVLRRGALTGDFPAILVAAVAGVAGGFLGAVGKDLYQSLKDYLKKRTEFLYEVRSKKLSTREAKDNIIAVYIMTRVKEIPVFYYSIPRDGKLDLHAEFEDLAPIESEIELLIESGQLSRARFIGVNLDARRDGPYLRLFSTVIDDDLIVNELLRAQESEESKAHALLSEVYTEAGNLERAAFHDRLRLRNDTSKNGAEDK